MKRNLRIVIFLALSLITSHPRAQELTATVTSVKGRSAVRSEGASEWSTVAKGATYRSLDKIRVDEGSLALTFSDGLKDVIEAPAAGSVESFQAEAELKRLLESELGAGEEEKVGAYSGGRAFKGGIAGKEDGAARAGITVRSVDLSLSEEVPIAVMPFEANVPDGELGRLGANIHKLLLGRLGEIEGVRFVERNQLAKSLDELKLSQTGLVDPAQAVKAGRMVGAKNIIIGELTSFPPMIDLNARVVEVETGAIVGKAVSVSGTGSKEAFKMIAGLASELGDVLRDEYKYRAPGPGAPRYDLCYILDSTGSMGDALEDLREFIDTHLVKLNRRSPVPDIRIAVVDYKDRSDPYVVNKIDFVPYTESDKVLQYLNSISASGGGDYPESVYSALMVAFADLDWDEGPEVTRMAFLLADSPPHTIYDDEPTAEEVIQAATAKNISLRVIGFQNLNNTGARKFEKLASATNGSFKRFGARTGGRGRTGASAAAKDLKRLREEGTRGSRGGIPTEKEDSDSEESEPEEELGDMLDDI